MRIENVQRGDIIVEGRGPGIEVKKIDGECNRTKVHINDRHCYDRGTDVQVRRGSRTDERDEELDDLVYV